MQQKKKKKKNDIKRCYYMHENFFKVDIFWSRCKKDGSPHLREILQEMTTANLRTTPKIPKISKIFFQESRSGDV